MTKWSKKRGYFMWDQIVVAVGTKCYIWLMPSAQLIRWRVYRSEHRNNPSASTFSCVKPLKRVMFGEDCSEGVTTVRFLSILGMNTVKHSLVIRTTRECSEVNIRGALVG